MKRILLPLVFLGLFCAASALMPAQNNKKKDRGHWALVYNKVLVDGPRTNGENSGIASARSGNAEFKILHVVAGSFKPDGTATVNGKPINTSDKNAYRDQVYEMSKNQDGGTTRIQMGGTSTATHRNIHLLSVKWTQPPQYVKVGEENKITVDVTATYDGKPYSTSAVQADWPTDKTTRALMAPEEYSCHLEVVLAPEIATRKHKINFDVVKYALSRSDSMEEFDKAMEINDEREEEAWEEAYEKVLGDYEGDMDWKDGASCEAKSHLSNTDSWVQELPLTKTAYMMVVVEAKAGNGRNPINPASQAKSFGTVTQVFLYQCFPDGGDVEVETRTDNEDDWDNGEDGSTGGSNGGEGGEKELPPWVIPVGVGVGVIGVSVLTKKPKDPQNPKGPKGGKKPKAPKGTQVNPEPTYPPYEPVPPQKNPSPGEEEKPAEKEKKKGPSTYKMILYKEFGKTLMAGDVPKMVGARIEEITYEGERKERLDLTRKIEITEGQNIQIVERGMAGKYRCARVKVDQMPADGSDEGFIYFTYREAGGAIRNKLIFKLEDGYIEFFQPNLTLPAFYDKTSKLPFVIHGASENAKVEVKLDSNVYSVTPVKGEVRNLWYAQITEDRKDPAEKKAKAGEYTIHTLRVTVTDVNKHVIEGSLPVLRYQMGLVFECDALVGCYTEKFDSRKHIDEIKIPHNGHYYSPALTRATYSLLTWDEEEHKLKRLVPSKATFFQALPLDEQRDAEVTDYMSRETKDLSDEELLQKLDLQIYVKEVLSDGSSIAYVYSAGAALDPPSRRKVKLHLETVYKDETYEAEQEVWITSQPRREMSIDQMRDFSKEDDQITENLWRICKFITDHDLLNRIGPVYRMAQMLLDGYDIRFGYDPGLVYVVRDSYLRFIRGEMLGANADAEPVEDMGLAAEIMVALAKTSVQAEQWLEDHGGVWTRVAIGFASLGWSEAGLLTVKVAKDMLDVVDRPEKPGGAWEAFCVGVKDVTINYVTEKVWSATLGLGAEFVATYHPELASTAASLMSKAAGNVQDKLGILGKDVRVIAKDMKRFVSDRIGKKMSSNLKATKSLQKSMSKQAEDVILDWRRNSQWSPEDALEDQIGRASNTDAIRKIKELEHAYIENCHYRTPETEEALRKMFYEFQSNKTAQKQLALYEGDWARNLRSEYYRVMQKDYKLIDKDALRSAAEELQQMGVNVHEEDLFVFCATNSDSISLQGGFTLTRDRDLSMMFRPKPTKANPNPLPVEVPQHIAEKCYGKAYKKHTGMTMEQGDQAVVQKGSKEMIGAGEKDLNRGFKKENFGEKFDDLDGVATAFEHKPEAWLQQGAALRKAGDIAGALSKEEEGLRQAIKLYFNSIEPRGTYRGTLTKLSSAEKEMFYILKKLEVKTQDSLSLSVTDVRKIFRERYNMELTDIPKTLKNMVYKLEA